jgi:hypothetical protein
MDAHAFASDDAEGFAVDCVAASEYFVQHARQRDFLVALPEFKVAQRWSEDVA